VNVAACIEAAGRNHRLWALIYAAGGYSHSLKNWWTEGKWAQNPGEPQARNVKPPSKMDQVRALRLAREAKG
jgi:murein endopeptidase